MTCVIGIDIGTTSTIGILLDTITNQIIKKESTYVEISKHIVNHLYEQSNSAQIKIGDVIIAQFDDIEYKETITNAIGVFKIENKIDFFQTYLENESFDVLVQKGINAKKVDKFLIISSLTILLVLFSSFINTLDMFLFSGVGVILNFLL